MLGAIYERGGSGPEHLRAEAAARHGTVSCMYVLEHLVDPHGPGVAAAVLTDDQPPRIVCRGRADLERDEPVTEDTVFELASLTKVMTATAVMRLVESGDLALDAPASDDLDALGQPSEGRPITVGDLLAHTSGLEDYLKEGMATPPEQATPEAIREALPAWGAAARPGIAHAYANTNYVVLAWLIEAVTGQTFPAYLQAVLFEPLGLRHTAVLGAGDPPEAVAQGYQQVGYGLPDYLPAEVIPLETLGDGGIVSTLRDLIRFQTAFWQGRVISHATRDRMTVAGTLDSGETFPYGLGLQVEQGANDQFWIGHGGSWTNATHLMGRYTAQRASVIVLTNEFMAPVERISQRIAASLA